jgi:hypothetical protein
LKSFVNAVLLPDEQVSEAIYNDNNEEEFSIPNIKTVDERGCRYDIEIEVADNSFGSAHLLYH